MQISLSSGDYSIVSSGQAFLFGLDENLKINIIADNGFQFSVILQFRKDTYGKTKIDKKVDGEAITLTCFNFDDMGTGLIKPVSIAQIEDREIFLAFWSYLEGSENGKIRSVKYTIFMSGDSGDHVDGK